MYGCAKGATIGARVGFQLLYRIFCDQKQGPRLGLFLSTLDRDIVRGRFREAAE